MYNNFSKTIAAISTAHFTSALSVIRVSGDESIDICSKCIVFPNGKKLEEQLSNTTHYATIISKDNTTIDTCMVSVFRAPKSATGENVVEISCHGGVYISSLVLQRIYECGAIPALPGEFSRRAFTNGKLSLTQAEAISNLIYAQTKLEIDLANKAISGSIKNVSEKIYSDVVHVISSIYAEIDFPDEGLEELSKEEIKKEITNIIDSLDKLEKSYDAGSIIFEGVKTCICGKPNVGKSTILNLLCKDDRAIVTDIAGTTRDTIKETVSCGNVKLHLVDTAGVRDSNDIIENLGIDKTIQEISKSDFLICVFDTSSPFDSDDEIILSKAHEKLNEGKPVLIVLNKKDISKFDLSDKFSNFKHIISIQANADETYAIICAEIENILSLSDFDFGSDAIISNARQHSIVSRCLDYAKQALSDLEVGSSFAGITLESLLGELGSLDGRNVTIEIVDDIFSRFCVGK